ncbi:MAG: ATP-binding protein [Candidatus Cyclonatronum sp.]|uniref:ATP-binding protein n=1 Tax=Cyclonatronum sp. TaxID=3024185 RepID=UPI0025C66340|nr:ATP-binding protein [Cyclonatronum sp.]MCH8488246.1 ATP-binding protein [Cyclonatronum sp.]
MYKRTLQASIEKRIGSGKAIIVTGPRQVGKTTLMTTILRGTPFLFLNGDDPSTREMLGGADTGRIRSILGTYNRVFIDEAQRIPDIGQTMKIITDQFKQVQLFASGSSSFDLANQLNEPLTGRKWEYQLFPVSWEEFEQQHGYLASQQQLEHRLIYGFYPDVLMSPGDEIPVLRNLVNSYLYRDLLIYGGIKKTDALDKLVRALAFQTGSEVSYAELGQMTGLDTKTVSRYIEILEKGYVVFRLGAFSRNLRNEIRKNNKIYFYDNGVRNMIIGNFDPPASRTDKGALWENFLVSERIKQIAYKESLARTYFWRTKQQQEVDWVEDLGGRISGFEFKWDAQGRERLSASFINTYKAESKTIDRTNFRDFVTMDRVTPGTA